MFNIISLHIRSGARDVQCMFLLFSQGCLILSSVIKRTNFAYRKEGQEPADVLNDIGNMLANLTDELDAMLLEEKRQGLTDE